MNRGPSGWLGSGRCSQYDVCVRSSARFNAVLVDRIRCDRPMGIGFFGAMAMGIGVLGLGNGWDRSAGIALVDAEGHVTGWQWGCFWYWGNRLL